ncbi:MAG: hypothetical protein EBS55_13805 [Flavobacteriaceae bacterium]|nr:hypothetical protein [Flavobacteriaceae bacterium]
MNFENFKTTHNRPAKFTGETYGIKISIDHDHSDLNIDELMDAFETIAIGLGYHKDSWKNWIVDRAKEYQEEENEKWESLHDLEDDFFGEWDEKRMDIIGQNGNEGLHYDEEGVDELLKRYNEPETQKKLRAFRDEELEKLRHEGYRATEEDEDEFDDYGQRIPEDRVTFEWGDEPEDDEDLFEGDEWKPNENLKAANERYKSEVKKMKAKQKRNK